ncbi:MAG: DUF4271 domain-containing protein [Flavihumibacter sp.]
MRRFLILLFFLVTVSPLFAQQAVDSLRTDSLARTAAVKPVQQPAVVWDSLPSVKLVRSNAYFNFGGKPVYRTIQPYTGKGKEAVFYVIFGLFLLLALVRFGFSRYFNHIFTVFFRASLKQKQIREQLAQTPLPSLLLNLLFVGTGGLYAAFVLHEKGSGRLDGLNFWLLYGYCVGGLILLYCGKYFILKMLGWTLRIEQTVDTYIFIVFLCNKVLAVFLLPLLMVAAFAAPGLVTISMTVSYVVVIGVFLYRYISSYGYINREVKTSRFHFFLYLCAFEVAPLLLIYKVLLKLV